MAQDKKLVYWDDKEKRLIKKEVLRIIALGKKMSFLDTMNQACLVLPQERRRRINGPSEVRWLGLSSKSQKNKPGSIVKESSHRSDEVAVKRVSSSVDSVTPEKTVEVLPAKPIQEVLFNSLNDILVPMIAQWMEPVVRDAVEKALEQSVRRAMSGEVLSDRLHKLLQSGLKTSAHKKQERKSVLVVGLIAKQMQVIDNEFKSCLNLRFCESSHAIRQIEDRMGQMDVVIGMTDFIGHSHESVMKKHNNYVRISGGMSALRDKLTEIYAQS